MKHTIDNIDYDSKSQTLTYCVDNKEDVSVTGEFYIKDGILHHTHIFVEDVDEVEIRLLVENTLTINTYPSNIDVFGYTKSLERHCFTIYTDGLSAFYDNEDETIAAFKRDIMDEFDLVDEWQLDRDLISVRGTISHKFE